MKRCFLMGGVAGLLIGMGAKAGWSADSLDYYPFAPGLYMADYPVFYTADKLVDKDGKTQVDDLGLRSYVNAVKVAYYTKGPFGKPLQLTAVVPFGKVELLNDHSSGLGDPTVVAGYWFLDDKAKGLGVGLGSYVDIPVGQYDAGKIANVGLNYWRVRPTLVMSKFVYPYDLEASLTYNINFENKDTKIRNGNEGAFDGFAGRFVSRQFLVGAHFNYLQGADKSLDGARLPDTAIRQAQAGPSVTWAPSMKFNIFLRVMRDFASRNTTNGMLYFLRAGWQIK